MKKVRKGVEQSGNAGQRPQRATADEHVMKQRDSIQHNEIHMDMEINMNDAASVVSTSPSFIALLSTAAPCCLSLSRIWSCTA